MLTGLKSVQTARRSFNVEIYKINCDNFRSPMKFFNCAFTKLDTNRFASDCALMLERQLLRNAEIGIEVTYVLPKGQNIVKFLQIKLNICDALEQLKTVPLLKKLFIELIHNSNIPYTCPIKGNEVYNMTGFIISDEVFPPYTPILAFNYTVSFYENQKLFATHHTQGATVPRSKI
ncbi:uncharacterized protein LOC106086491 [Stomoxys calcitrans]|nr:uncharacterized protein LOC106086491 [Stomoxys calcitrans]